MLVLSRKIGEAVMIGPKLQVEVGAVDPEERSVELIIRGGTPSGGNGHSLSRTSRGGVVLSVDESHHPAAGVEVTLVDVRDDKDGPKARLGVTAPGMTVHRREVYEAILREQQRAQDEEQEPNE
jgi:sRNA-binding carbon storage regulator CsrA